MRSCLKMQKEWSLIMFVNGPASRSISRCRSPNSSTIKKLNILVDCLISDHIKFVMSANDVTPSHSFNIALLKAHVAMEPSVSMVLSPSVDSNLSRKCFLGGVSSGSSLSLQPRSETKIATRSHHWNVSSIWCLGRSSHEIFQMLLLRKPPLTDNHDSYPRSWRRSHTCKVSHHHPSIQHTGSIGQWPVCYWNMPCL